MLGFCVVAETHERGGAAADHARRVLAQVPEQQRDRRPAQVARFRETLEVAPGDLVGPGDEHRGRFLRGTTMGFTLLEGLVMATRSGTVDPGLVLWLEEHERPIGTDLAAPHNQAGVA